MRRPQCYNLGGVLGAGLKRGRLDAMPERQAWQGRAGSSPPSIAQGDNDDERDDRNRDDHDRGHRGCQCGCIERDNQQKGNRVAMGERGKRREGDNRQATTSKNSGRNAMSINATERAVATTVSGAFATRRTPTSFAGGAVTTIAATTCKKQSRAKKRLASNLREQREARCTSSARRELHERGGRNGSCLHRCNDNDDGGNYCDDCDRHRQQGARGARCAY